MKNNNIIRAGNEQAYHNPRKSRVRSFVFASLFAALGSQAEVPNGWFAPPATTDYVGTLDQNVSHTGKASASISTSAANPKNFGNLMQSFAADNYRGKRVRLTGYVKALNAGSAQFWMRVDSKRDSPTAFDNMDNRPVKGTAGWTKCELVLDVAEDATSINLGCMLIGTGKLWFDDLKFEVVGKDVPVTDMGTGRAKGPKGPQNLDLEAKE